MSEAAFGLLIGGFLPAVILGFFAVCTKFSSLQGLSTSFYILFVGISVTVVGAVASVLFRSNNAGFSVKGMLYACLAGVYWALSMMLMNIVITRYNIGISKLIPLVNMNTLTSVALGLWIFAEWKTAHLGPLTAGALLITLGGIIISRS